MFFFLWQLVLLDETNLSAAYSKLSFLIFYTKFVVTHPYIEVFFSCD